MSRRVLWVAASVAASLFIPSAASAATVWAVGDGAGDGQLTPQRAAAVVSRIEAEGGDRLLWLGEVAPRGTIEDFRTNYDPVWGRLKSITRPSPGNHDWEDEGRGYDAYWGPGVRQPGGGHWYSFDLAGWHFVSLSSVEPIGWGSAQLAWLRSDLARYRGSCTIAFDHHPRYSAGPQFNRTSMEPAWATLSGRAAALLSAHAHNYQRHLPVRSLTQFVVGTGGSDLGNVDDLDPRLAAGTDRTYGALRLDLGLGEARYAFVAADGSRLDGGSLECVPHSPTPVRIRILRPRPRATYRAFRMVRGRVRNARRVRLTILRRAGRRCLAFDGRRFRLRSCRTRLSVPAAGRTRWRYRLRRGTSLPEGGYRITVWARGLDRSLRSRSVRFAVGTPVR